jgi:hypothetical protein
MFLSIWADRREKYQKELPVFLVIMDNSGLRNNQLILQAFTGLYAVPRTRSTPPKIEGKLPNPDESHYKFHWQSMPSLELTTISTLIQT